MRLETKAPSEHWVLLLRPHAQSQVEQILLWGINNHFPSLFCYRHKMPWWLWIFLRVHTLTSTCGTPGSWISHQQVLWCAQHQSKGNQIVSWEILSMSQQCLMNFMCPAANPPFLEGTKYSALWSPGGFLLCKLSSCMHGKAFAWELTHCCFRKLGYQIIDWVTAFIGCGFLWATWIEFGCFSNLRTICLSAPTDG